LLEINTFNPLSLLYNELAVTFPVPSSLAQASIITKPDSVSFDELLNHHNPFEANNSNFNLLGVKLVTPGALAPLAAACHALA